MHLISAIVILVLTNVINAGPSFKNERTKLPSFVKICRRSDPQLNICARNTIQNMKSRLHYGIPELYVPPIDPLVVPEIKMDQDSGAIYLHSTFKDINIHGISNFTLNDITINPTKLRFVMSMSFQNVSLKAQYTMKGKIMMMPLMGDGEFKANFTNVDLTTQIVGQLYKKHDRPYVKVKDVKVRYTLGKAHLHLDNLFNGDKALGERMNIFVNENWESLSDEIRPMMEKAVADIIRASTVKLFEKYSYDDLLPE